LNPNPMNQLQRPHINFDVATRYALPWLLVMLAALGLYVFSPVHNRLVLGGLFAACLPIAILRPEWALYALIATFPFGDLRHDAHWALGASLIASLGCRYVLGGKPLRELRATLWPWALAFLTFNALSNLFSPYPDEAWAGFIRLASGCFFLLLPIAILSRRSFMRRLPLVLIGAITTASVFAIVGYVFTIPIFLEKVEVFKRATGGSVSPNTLALLIVVATPFLVHDAFYARHRLGRGAAQAALVINLGAMVTTYSRGGLLLLLILAFVLAALYFRHLTPARVASFALWGLTFVLATFVFNPTMSERIAHFVSRDNAAEEVSETSDEHGEPEPGPSEEAQPEEEKPKPGKPEQEEVDYYWDRQQSLVDKDDFSVSRRFSYILAARDSFLERPILGYGTMTFDEYYARSEYSRQHSRNNRGGEHRRSHNTYLEVLAGNGLPGLVLFFGLLLRAWRNGWQAWSAARRNQQAGVCQVLETYGLSYLFLLLYFGLQSALFMPLFWLYLGLSEVARRLFADPPSSPNAS